MPNVFVATVFTHKKVIQHPTGFRGFVANDLALLLAYRQADDGEPQGLF
ncbi:hypothetical protein [Glaesserella parasuis]|nr:hypothetical protein [Glaesserella parasuis]